MTEHERILDKVKRLLALGQSANANEAAVAIAQAQRLMREHQIEQAMLDTGKREVDPMVASGKAGASAPGGTVDPLDSGMARRQNWRGTLSYTLSHAHQCRTWWTGPVLHVGGRANDVAAVRYLYAYCVREIDRLTADAARGQGRTWANNFRLGCVDAISVALKEEKAALETHLYEAAAKRAEAERSAVALVRLDSALATVRERDESVQAFIDRTLNLSNGGFKARWDKGAREAGRQAGKNINVGRSAPGLKAGRGELS